MFTVFALRMKRKYSFSLWDTIRGIFFSILVFFGENIRKFGKRQKASFGQELQNEVHSFFQNLGKCLLYYIKYDAFMPSTCVYCLIFAIIGVYLIYSSNREVLDDWAKKHTSHLQDQYFNSQCFKNKGGGGLLAAVAKLFICRYKYVIHWHIMSYW